MKDSDNIHLRSDEVQEILSRPPHSLLRYGILVISLILVIGFIGSFVFSYPDRVQGTVTITTSSPPVWVIARSEGMLRELFCADNQQVEQGMPLAVIDNPATTADLLHLTDLLQELHFNDTTIRYPGELLNHRFELGPVQQAYTQLISATIAYENFLKLNLTEKEQSIVRQQLDKRLSYRAILARQLSMKEQEVAIARAVYERDQTLYQQKVLSASELEQAEQLLLMRKNELEQLKTAASLETIETAQLSGSLQKLSIQQQREKNQLYGDLRNSLLELETAVANWHYTYLLSAPIDGTVSFSGIWKEKQHISKDQKVMAIVPAEEAGQLGKMLLPLQGAGKIAPGQRVLIKVADYPYLEYGMLQGTVSSSSLVAEGEYYSVEISFENGLKTTTGRELPLRGELTGHAEIITNNRSLFARITAPIYYLITKSRSY